MTSPLLVGSSAYPQREASSRPIGVVPIGALPTVQPEKVLVALQQRTLLTKRQSPGSGAQIQLRTDGLESPGGLALYPTLKTQDFLDSYL